MRYQVYGPYKMNKHDGMIDQRKISKNVFWEQVAMDDPALCSACGCYLFAVRASKGIKPCYVGMAAKQPFINECFSPHKLNVYNLSLGRGHGTPLLFLIAKLTGTGKFAKPCKNGDPAIEWLEMLMIGAALEKNPDLMNIQNTAHLRKMCVPGLINTPARKPSAAESKFRMAIQ